MQKDLYMLNLINNRINKKKLFGSNSNNNKRKNQICPKLLPNVAKTTELVFDSDEINKKKAKEDYSGYMTCLLRNKFLNFNPITSKNQLINYREYLFKDIPTYKGKPRIINGNYYMDIYKQKMREQSYQNWKKIKSMYRKNNISEDKYILTDYNFNYDYKENKIFNHPNKYLNAIKTEKRKKTFYKL